MHPVVEAGDLAGRTEHDPLVVELGGDQPPAGILLAHQHLSRNAYVVVVGRIRVVRTVGEDDRRPRVPRIGGVDDQDRNPFVFGSVRVGAAGQPDIVGVVSAGGPDLLAVHDVLVPMADRGGAQRGEVGTGLRFGIADREVHLAREDRRQEFLLLHLGAVHLKSRPHGLQRDSGQRYVGAGRLVDEDLLLDGPIAEASVLGGPAHPELAVGAHPLDHRPVGLAMPVDLHLLGLVGRDEGGEVLPHLRLQMPLFGGQFYIHCAPTRSSR